MIARDVTVSVPPEVATRIAEPGLEAEIDRVVDSTRQNVESLGEIRLHLFDDELEPDGKRIKFIVIKEGPYVRCNPERHAWIRGILEPASIHFLRWVSFDLYAREMLNGR